MRVIYKYKIGFEKTTLPLGDFVSFGVDGGDNLCVWQYESDNLTNPNLQSHSYLVVGTGWEIPDGYYPVRNSSVVTPEGLVWHLVRDF